jgi:hypothetical protein
VTIAFGRSDFFVSGKTESAVSRSSQVEWMRFIVVLAAQAAFRN